MPESESSIRSKSMSSVLRPAAGAVALLMGAAPFASAATFTFDNGDADGVIKDPVNWSSNSLPSTGNEGVIDSSSALSTLYFGNSALGVNGTYGRLTLNSPTLTSILAANFAPATSTTYSVRLNGASAAGASAPVTVLSLGAAQAVAINDSANAVLNFQLGQAESVIDVGTGGNLTIGSKIISAPSVATNFTKTGAGTLTLTNAANTFGTAATTLKISGGTVSASTSAALGNTTAGAISALTLDGGTLQFNATSAQTVARTLNITANGGTIETVAPATGSGDITLSTGLAGSNPLTKLGAARLILSAAGHL